MKIIKQKVEKIEVELVDSTTDSKKKEEIPTAKPSLNIVISTYYKGTALEGLTKKLEEYLDEAPKGENTINYL